MHEETIWSAHFGTDITSCLVREWTDWGQVQSHGTGSGAPATALENGTCDCSAPQRSGLKDHSRDGDPWLLSTPEIWPRTALWLRALSLPLSFCCSSLRGRVPFVKAANEWMLCYIIKIVSTTDLPSTFCAIKIKSVHIVYKQVFVRWHLGYESKHFEINTILFLSFFFLTSDCDL